LRAARAFKKDNTVPPGVDDPYVYTNVRSGDFLADAKVRWRDAHDMQQRTAFRALAKLRSKAVASSQAGFFDRNSASDDTALVRGFPVRRGPGPCSTDGKPFGV
jgi:hypothetical protein